MRPNNNAFYLDLLVMIIVSILIAFKAQDLLFMTITIPSILMIRLFFVVSFNRSQASDQLIFIYLVATIIGAFNDYNSVVIKKIYSYTVPVYFESLSSIPIWMLLFWGMILQFILSLKVFLQSYFDELNCNSNTFSIPALLRKFIIQAGILLSTRQCIYLFFMDPFWSWFPFAVALTIYTVFYIRKKSEVCLLLFAIIIGPMIEAIFITIGKLHFYHLGIFFGVPFWIILWWPLAALIWSDWILYIFPRICTESSKHFQIEKKT